MKKKMNDEMSIMREEIVKRLRMLKRLSRDCEENKTSTFDTKS